MGEKAKKINVKDHFQDGKIDLSMSDLREVPVNAIASLKKTYSLDLSNNEIVTLPNTFASLTSLTHLDLSKNKLRELPDNFGDLTKLKRLDLYQNQLEHLPLSFNRLKNLKWLDLKDNPLTPKLAQVAGPCLENVDCEACAIKIVNFLANVQTKVDTDMVELQREQEIEGDKLKKQKEKKKLKKEKQKAAQLAKENKKAPIMAVKNGTKASNTVNKTKLSKHVSIWQRFHFLFRLFFVMFVATSLLGTNSFVRQYLGVCYFSFVEKLPSSVQTYFLIFGNVMSEIHEMTGYLFIKFFTYVRNHAYTKIVVLKVQEIYTNIINNDNVKIVISKCQEFL